MTASRLISRRHVLAAATLAVPAFSTFAQTPRTLRIGHQTGVLSYLKARGTLEKRLAPLGVSITWTEFNAGPVQLEALNVGAIDFGDVGEAPPIFAQAAGAPLVYVAATAPLVSSEAVVVPKGSTVQKIADLKGQKVAYNQGSNPQRGRADAAAPRHRHRADYQSHPGRAAADCRHLLCAQAAAQEDQHSGGRPGGRGLSHLRSSRLQCSASCVTACNREPQPLGKARAPVFLDGVRAIGSQNLRR